MTEQKPKKDVQAYLALAFERFRRADEAEQANRVNGLDDKKFESGDQWPEDIRVARQQDKRPCLVINRMPQFVHQVSNEQRRNRPGIEISAVDDSDVDAAEVREGLIRHIETASNASYAYETAGQDAAVMGWGYFRVVTEYEPGSFNQQIRIQRIKNAFSVYFDPDCQEPDYSDGQFAFVTVDYTPEEFKQQFPKSELASLGNMESVGNRVPMWLTGKSVRVAEYFHIEYKERTLLELPDGTTGYADELPADVVFTKHRTEQVPYVCWAKINAVEILEEKQWPGQWIPIIPVLGDERVIDNEVILSGLIRGAKDSQRSYNYWSSAETETIALAPRAPWVAAEGQIEGYEAQYAMANQRNIAVLPYKPKALGNVLVPPPQRQVVEPPIQAISMARMAASEDIKSTMGMYDAAIGARSNETSGKAIQARQQEGDTANYHYIDNLGRAIKHCGRIINDLIPHIYDAPRILRIIGRDEQEQTVAINQPTKHKGVEKIFDLTSGKYDVTVNVGPSFANRRKEALESMSRLVEAYPELLKVAGDLLVRNMEFPGAAKLADRLMKTLPAELQEEDGNAQIPPKFQAQFAQLMQQHEFLTAALNKAQDALENKSLELENKKEIAYLQAQVELTKVQAQLGSNEAIAHLKAEIDSIRHGLDLNAQQQAAERQAEQQGADREHASSEAAQDRQHASAESAQDREAAAQQAAMKPQPKKAA